jgi:hypothetical protein
MERLESKELTRLQNKTYIVKEWTFDFMTDQYIINVYDTERAEDKTLTVPLADIYKWEEFNR